MLKQTIHQTTATPARKRSTHVSHRTPISSSLEASRVLFTYVHFSVQSYVSSNLAHLSGLGCRFIAQGSPYEEWIRRNLPQCFLQPEIHEFGNNICGKHLALVDREVTRPGLDRWRKWRKHRMNNRNLRSLKFTESWWGLSRFEV